MDKMKHFKFSIFCCFYNIKKCFRINEFKESHIVAFHRVVACAWYLTLTTYYCSNGHGVCRPLPLKSYLLGDQINDKYTRDQH